MDLVVKQVPIFSRAFCDSESEDEYSQSESESSELEDQFIGADGHVTDPLENLGDRHIDRVVVALGPIQTAFLACSLRIANDTAIAKLPLRLFAHGKTSEAHTPYAFLHFVSVGAQLIAVILIPSSKQPIRVKQRDAVEQLLTDTISKKFNPRADPDVVILCSLSVYHFQSHTGPPSVPFLRLLTSTTRQHTATKEPLSLEIPNIISGFPAEFLSWFEVHSVPARLYILYYAPHENVAYAWSAVKELFAAMSPVSGILSDISTNWDALGDEKLREACVLLVSGDKPNKMDQMYT